MAGKSDIINLDSMENLLLNGNDYILAMKESINNLELIMAEMREARFAGEKGLACKQALNSISILTNDLTIVTEKVAVYMEAKINKQTKNHKHHTSVKHKDKRLYLKR